ncbi:hypothetical protein B0H13DRAFT_2660440 [Mycena leptocephala]|nr:hypothetical protein B0H13DRAFT_2660440 [Mycena leptocephala]
MVKNAARSYRRRHKVSISWSAPPPQWTRPASAILSATAAMARVPPPARVRVVAMGTDSDSNSRRRWSHAFRPSTPAPEPALDVPVDAASPGDEHNEEEVDRVHVEVQQLPHD